jgi:cullin-associated NEDD8-dissociated protein 1
MALKSIVQEIPSTPELLLPKLEVIINQILTFASSFETSPQHASELLQILNDIYTRFSRGLAANKALQKKVLDSLFSIISNARASVRKRAVPALTALISTSPSTFNATAKAEILRGLQMGGETGRYFVMTVSSLARGSSVGQVGDMLREGQVVPIILQQTEDVEEAETVEGALIVSAVILLCLDADLVQALETLVLRCPTEMESFNYQLLQRALELVRYDPVSMELN